MDRRKHPTDLVESLAGQASLPGAFRLGYPLLRDHWDEVVTKDGAMRPHWDALMAAFSRIPPEEMGLRWERAQRLIRENGVTYNVYGDPEGLSRPWQLDPVPMILPAAEWRGIEAALSQRAMLLEKVLADLYGPRQLLIDGLLPPSLILGHPGYLRAVRGIEPFGGIRLHLYAADIARDPDGNWLVVSDRCEAPSGAGYALENRVIIARTLPELLRAQPIEPLAPFFQKLYESLHYLAPRRREAPRIVILTPGPFNETFFEHAYLARHLGYTLVEGEDLTVRDGCVFLKTLDGLQQVDVILRRTDAVFCDPLELKSDSTLGIPGLIQAVRAGTVVIANSLGSGLVEGGLLAPYLPALSRHLLGETLKMPSAGCLWLGEGNTEEVLSHIGDHVIRPAYPGQDALPPLDGQPLDPRRQAELARLVRQRPQAFLAKAPIRLSTTPVWHEGKMDARPMMLRVYLAADPTNPDGGYAVMPGGLTRIAPERAGSVISMQYGDGSKDCWVQAEGRDKPVFQLRSAERPVKLQRGARDLPSRVADNLFWLGRLLERTEDLARLLRAVLSRSGGPAGFSTPEDLTAALSLYDSFTDLAMADDPDDRVAGLILHNFDPDCPQGLMAMVERVHRLAGLTRDRLSLDTWRAVTRLVQLVGHAASGEVSNSEDVLNLLNDLVLASEALSGLAMENMTRGLAWRFIDIGRRLERGIYVVDIVSGALSRDGAGAENALDALLEVSDSSMTYRSRYLSSPQFAPVLDLLLADESNPRALAFQLGALNGHAEHLATVRRQSFIGSEQRLTIWLHGAVRTADIEALAHPDEDGGRRQLSVFLETLRSKMWELSATLTQEYFAHAMGRPSTVEQVLREALP